MLYWLIKFHCLVAFNSWDIGQYVSCNSLLTRLWRHQFRNTPYLSNQAGFFYILRTKKVLKENKKHFLSFLKGYHWSKYFFFFGRWELLVLRKTLYTYSTNDQLISSDDCRQHNITKSDDSRLRTQSILHFSIRMYSVQMYRCTLYVDDWFFCAVIIVSL